MASQKPETRFYSAVNRFLKSTHCEKMSNPWRSGTADLWYSGDRGDLWVEYKYVERIPKSVKILPDLSAQQRKWLNGRYMEGRNIAVILGAPDGGVIYRDLEWLEPLDTASFVEKLMSRKALAGWIHAQVGDSRCR